MRIAAAMFSLFVFSLVGLFPPWHYTKTNWHKDAGFAPIFCPPPDDVLTYISPTHPTIDFGRLFVLWVSVAALSLAIFLAVWSLDQYLGRQKPERRAP